MSFYIYRKFLDHCYWNWGEPSPPKKEIKSIQDHIEQVNTFDKLICDFMIEQTRLTELQTGNKVSQAYFDEMRKLIDHRIQPIIIAYRLNCLFNKQGKNYIEISPFAYDFIIKMNVAKVVPEAIVVPFQACCFIMDKTPLKDCASRLYGQIENDFGTCYVPENYTGFEAIKNETEVNPHITIAQTDPKTMLTMGDIKHVLNNIVNQTIPESELIDDPIDNPNHQEEHDNFMKVATFFIKACIFISMHPDCLKHGSFIDVEKWVTVGKKKRKKRVIGKGKKETLRIAIPNNYKNKEGHFVEPFVRSLHDPKYARHDGHGNKLPIGEPGFIRIIPVKGHFRGGSIHHIDV